MLGDSVSGAMLPRQADFPMSLPVPSSHAAGAQGGDLEPPPARSIGRILDVYFFFLRCTL